MQQLVKGIRTIFSIIEKIFEAVSMIMLVAMVVIICYQVIMRSVFNNSPSWSEEISLTLLIWFGILSIPIGVRLHLHIGIEYLFTRLPQQSQWVVSRVLYVLIAAFGCVMLISGVELVKFTSMSTLPATKLPSSIRYAVIPLAGLTLIYNALELFFTSYSSFAEQGDEQVDVIM
ncbi:TRAP transporter permease DctQ [candidate division KSB3 bacterium]|uniref:TRAP transporter permease DctQ n=1 Tax=candidate division KSB3 bacterium TaxID=2044937 RepID=A0A2G6E2H5_9BACT|nr:MAG: TRAP transporter permease DctQ [candidate division KSB3 bacterium]PIE28872.1 MAG: TRAP transporter permease DctQ [candidate division KSB3 bacterium]